MIAGRYSLEREIGRGGMGAVWLARDEVLGRQVALKRVGFGPGGSAADLERAEREARLAARLNHPHVVAVFDLVTAGDERWLVMEYVEGATLAALVRRDGPLSPDAAAPLLHQAADALAAAHRAEIVHRDVKPSNILVAPDGQVKLSDFGIARAEADASLTQTGLVTGSPAYLAPEVASGQHATAASDVWSLGATLYHALAGHPPYEVGDNVLGALYRIVHERPPRLGAAAGWLEPALEATMIQQPERRWTMAQVRDFLTAGPAPSTTRVVAPLPAPVPVGAPVAAAPAPGGDGTRLLSVVPPPTPPRTTPTAPGTPGRARRRAGWLPVVVAIIAIVAMGVAAWLLGSRNDPGDGAGEGTGSGASAPATSAPTKAPTKATVTAAGMEDFVADYLATVTTDPKTTWAQLTPSFQAQSGNYGQYQRFWGTIESAELVSAEADPSTKTISYQVEYVHQDGRRSADDVTLRLEGTDGSYRIAEEG